MQISKKISLKKNDNVIFISTAKYSKKEELSFSQRLKLVYYLATDSIHKFPFIEYFKAKKYKLSIDNIDSFLVSDGEKLLAINIEVNLSDHKFLFYCN